MAETVTIDTCTKALDRHGAIIVTFECFESVAFVRNGAAFEAGSEAVETRFQLDWLVDEILLASRLDSVTEARATEELDLLALAAEECARYDDVQLEVWQ